MILKIERTDLENEDFHRLVVKLEKYLASLNGEVDSVYKQYNQLDNNKYPIVAYKDKVAVGCGAIR